MKGNRNIANGKIAYRSGEEPEEGMWKRNKAVMLQQYLIRLGATVGPTYKLGTKQTEIFSPRANLGIGATPSGAIRSISKATPALAMVKAAFGDPSLWTSKVVFHNLSQCLRINTGMSHFHRPRSTTQ
jgi:hypothetical protein